MTQALMASRIRLRVQRSTGLVFIATTMALVLLASLGIAVLVQFGSGGPVVVPPQVIAPVAAGPVLRPGAQNSPPPVARIIGSFQAPVVDAGQAGRGPTLGELLSPPHVTLPKPKPTPDQPADPLALPTSIPTAFPTGPPPSPVALPVPVPFPGPITVPLPAPLPDIILFPGGLVTTSPTPLPVPLP